MDNLAQTLANIADHNALAATATDARSCLALISDAAALQDQLAAELAGLLTASQIEALATTVRLAQRQNRSA